MKIPNELTFIEDQVIVKNMLRQLVKTGEKLKFGNIVYIDKLTNQKWEWCWPDKIS